MLLFLISALMLSASISSVQPAALTPERRHQIETLTESAGDELTCLTISADRRVAGDPAPLLEACRTRHGWNEEEAALALHTATLTRHALLARRGLVRAGLDYSKIETVWLTLSEAETNLIARANLANVTPELNALIGTFPGRLRAAGITGPLEADAFAALMVAVQAKENARFFMEMRVRRGMQSGPAQTPGD